MESSCSAFGVWITSVAAAAGVFAALVGDLRTGGVGGGEGTGEDVVAAWVCLGTGAGSCLCTESAVLFASAAPAFVPLVKKSIRGLYRYSGLGGGNCI